MNEHMTELEIATYLEGRLSPWQRRQVERHLAHCSACGREIGEISRWLREADLLPPRALFHPLELWLLSLVSWRRGLGLSKPQVLLHVLFFALTPLLWLALVDVAAIPHLQSPILTLAPWPAALLMTGHFVWLQPKLRQLIAELWQAGAPYQDVEAFQERFLVPLYGWRWGGMWLFLGLGLATTLANWVIIPPDSTWEGIKRDVLGLYAVVATMAMYWGWLWGGRLWCGLARLWQHEPALVNHPVSAHARRLASAWVGVAGGSMAWHLAITTQMTSVRPAHQVWGALISLALLSLWSGYAALEWRVGQGRPSSLSWGWLPASRLLVTAILAVLPFGVVVW
ncbi:MAG: zf-HC2 domain-containing protein [Anaerolineae bacterium]|nr:zf-HC2 domain-containing protein [Anaerolineae bacterium]